jgi:hypothetical protein
MKNTTTTATSTCEVILKEVRTVPNSEMPMLVLDVVEDHWDSEAKKTIIDNVICHGYLTPFRGYRFQVSGTDRGEGDFGSTTVTALKAIADMVVPTWKSGAPGYQMNADPATAVVRDLSELAMLKFAERNGAHLSLFGSNELLDEFVEKTLNYIRSL